MRGPEDGFIILPAPLQENKSYPGPKASDGQGVITFDPEHGFRVKVSGLSINSLVGVDVQRDLGKKEFPEFPLISITWAVGWRQQIRVEARLGSVEGPVLETGIEPFWALVASTVRPLPDN
jgi:hypothetical protein